MAPLTMGEVKESNDMLEYWSKKGGEARVWQWLGEIEDSGGDPYLLAD